MSRASASRARDCARKHLIEEHMARWSAVATSALQQVRQLLKVQRKCSAISQLPVSAREPWHGSPWASATRVHAGEIQPSSWVNFIEHPVHEGCCLRPLPFGTLLPILLSSRWSTRASESPSDMVRHTQ